MTTEFIISKGRARRCVLTWLCCVFAIISTTIPSYAASLPKVVSLNLCTDQLAVLLAAPGQLLSVSALAHDSHMAYLAGQTKAYPVNHGSAEEVFVLHPDLVLAGTYTTPATIAILRRLKFEVRQLAPEKNINDIRGNITKVGKWLQREEAAKALLASFDSELAALHDNYTGPRPLAVVYESNGVTIGSGDLADSVITMAGFDNLAHKLGITGMNYLSLESLIVNQPDLVIVTQDWTSAPALAQQAFKHPALQGITGNLERERVADKAWICGGPFTLEAVRSLRKIRDNIIAKKAVK